MSRVDQLLAMYEKDKNDPFIPYGIALEYISQNDITSAENYLKLSLAADEAYVPAYMQYAQLLVNLNQTEKAKELYRKGIMAARTGGDHRSANEMEEFLEELN